MNALVRTVNWHCVSLSWLDLPDLDQDLLP
jgi:hypothetical protein